MTLRALEVLRDVPLIAAEDTRHTRRLLDRHGDRDPDDELPRPERAVADDGAARPPARRRRPRARHRCRDAGRQRPGRGPRGGVGRRGRPGRADPGRVGRAGRGGRQSGVAGPRWAFEGFLPRTGRERRERLAPDRRRRPRHGRSSRRPDGWRPRCGTWPRPAAPSDPAAVCRELTKLHETIVRGSLGDAGRRGRGRRTIPPRGEFVLVVGAWPDGRPGRGRGGDRRARGRARGGRAAGRRGHGPRRGRPTGRGRRPGIAASPALRRRPRPIGFGR